jgi:uncharacterized protein (DUF1501 family)
MSNLHLPRRSFLGATAAAATTSFADMTLLNRLRSPALAAELKQTQKRVILLWLAGGASQLETFDPKPGRPTGGPYRAIPTNVPGVHISELMPKMATRMHRTAIIRSLNTKIADHGGGATLMQLGRRDEASLRYPDLGAVVARELGRADATVPDYVSFYAMTEGRGTGPGKAGFLGSRYQAMFLSEKSTPDNLDRSELISDVDHKERADLRELLSKRFARGRETAAVGSHNTAYARVRGLMASETLFDLEQEPQAMRDRYGPTQFGRQALIARRLCEAGVPFVKVGRGWWDSHGENFETHLELVSELDHVMSTLLDDLDERGLLKDTLVVTLSEFGRTPRINGSLGRDHFASAWSTSLTGCGIKGGACYGASDADGQTVKDGEIGAASLFATIYQALGIDVTKEYHVGPRPVPIVDNFAGPVPDVLI